MKEMLAQFVELGQWVRSPYISFIFCQNLKGGKNKMKNEVVKSVVKQPVTKKIGGVILKNSPAILTGISVAGVVTTTIMAVQATPKAIELVKQREHYESELDPNFNGLCKKEIIKTAWKCYIPTTIMGSLTIACIISAHTVNHKRNAALASLYSLTEKSLREYQAKVIETIGKNKERQVRNAVAEQNIKDNPVTTKELIITGKGETLCYDAISGRYFKSDVEKIRQALNKLSRDLMSEMFISLNEVYYELGLSSTKMGDMLGWHIDDGLIEPKFSSHLAEDGIPCLVLNFSIEPSYIYYDTRIKMTK